MVNQTDRVPKVSNYIQLDKIDHLYRQTVDRVEKQVVEVRGLDKEGTLSTQVGVGKVLEFLGIGWSVTGGLGLKSAKSRQVITELASEQKLEIVLRLLIKENSLFYLNQCLKENKIIVPNSVVSFEAVAIFEFYESDRKSSDSEEKILVSGTIEAFEFRFLCSRKYFLSDSSVELDIYEGIERKLNGIASLKDINYKESRVSLNPIYF